MGWLDKVTPITLQHWRLFMDEFEDVKAQLQTVLDNQETERAQFLEVADLLKQIRAELAAYKKGMTPAQVAEFRTMLDEAILKSDIVKPEDTAEEVVEEEEPPLP